MTDNMDDAPQRTRGEGPAEEILLPYEIDPAAPLPGEEEGDPEAARNLANYGSDADKAMDEVTFDLPPELLAALPIDWAKAQAFLHSCVTSNPRVTYGLGAKVPSDASIPGRDFLKVDCSGFVRAAIRRSTTPKIPFPDGSVVQHDWIREKGFARGTIADGRLTDGKIRIAFLSPNDTSSGIGHVVLIRNGRTMESHSGVGPNSRSFDGTGWQQKARVYLLAG